MVDNPLGSFNEFRRFTERMEGAATFRDFLDEIRQVIDEGPFGNKDALMENFSLIGRCVSKGLTKPRAAIREVVAILESILIVKDVEQFLATEVVK